MLPHHVPHRPGVHAHDRVADVVGLAAQALAA
jgi:hypothetical protein